MKLKVAAEALKNILEEDIEAKGVAVDFDRTSPDGDEGKFQIDGRPARTVQPFNGFYANINLDWFDGSEALPEIQGGTFYWYVFALQRDPDGPVTDYFIADYHWVRERVLDFDAPEGDDHQDHHDWRGFIRFTDEDEGVFVWGDEDPERQAQRASRRISLNNIDNPATLNTDSSADEAGAMEYKDFGPAPRDDPDELQEFAQRVRRGQPEFREGLLKVYDERCAVTGVGPPEVLEAAHIASHAETGWNDLDNGLLLRADIHYLFDDGLLRIDPEDLTIEIDGKLEGTEYEKWDDRRLRPRQDGDRPSREALLQKYEPAG